MAAAALAYGALVVPAPAYGQDKLDLAKEAKNRFREGKFAAAAELCQQVIAREPENYEATLGLGSIAVLRNDLPQAERWLSKALALKPTERVPKEQLAVVYYRRDDFAKAAALYRTLGVEVVAKKLESFAGVIPYRVEGKSATTQVPFVHTDPLPLIQVKVGGETANFLIDTGAAELYLDPELAKKVSAMQFGATTGLYGGGMQAETGQGRVAELTLGDFIVHDVPVLILSTRRFDVAARGKRVDGVLGTVLLEHFLATIDYPGSQLVLRRKNQEQLAKFQEQTRAGKGAVFEIPFWLAGQHLMVGEGRVNKSKPMLFFADTGLAGGGFTCPKSTMADAGIKLPSGPEFEGQGGGGKMKVQLFKVDELSFGPVTRRDIQAFAGVFPEAMEYGQGFRIGGFISHQFFRPYALTIDFTGMRFVLTGDK
jgi:tetratricopeptide (TPR) repeat protein